MADAAVLYHGESEWCGGAYMYYQKPGRKLMEYGLDYDVVPADLFGETLETVKGSDSSESVYHLARVEDGRLMIGEESYTCLILPYAQYLAESVIHFVAEAAHKGLKVFVVDALPEKDVHGNPLPDCWEDNVEVVPLGDMARRVAALVEQTGTREIIVERMVSEEKPDREGNSRPMDAGKAIDLVKDKDGQSFPWLRSFLVRQTDGVAAMYFNESVSQRYCGRIRVKNPVYRTVSIYDPWQNRMQRYALQEAEVLLYLEPGEAMFYCFEGQEGSGNVEESTGHNAAGAADDQDNQVRNFPLLQESIALDLNWKVHREPQEEQGLQQAHGQQGEEIFLLAGQPLPNLNGPGYWPSFVGSYVYEGSFDQKKKEGMRYFLLFPEASDSIRVVLNGRDLGFLAGFPARVEITKALTEVLNQIRVEVTTTLVWKLKDGASTHLQVPPTGMTKQPVLQIVL